MPKFDLISQPWIRTPDGPRGLADVLAGAHRLVLQASGPEHTALMRVLTVLAARISGLDAHTSPEAFADHRSRLLAQGRLDPKAVHAYLRAHEDKFDLFDADRPWMQDPRLVAACPKQSGLWKLAWGRGTPDRPGHFWWGPLDLPIPTPQAALDLLTQYMFGAGGKVTARATAPGGKRASTAGMGPLRGSVSYHPQAADLFQSLLLGMPYIPRTGPDAPPWEAPLPDPLAPVATPTGLASLVLGRFRHAILLDPDPDGTQVLNTWVTWGAQAATEPARDPWQITHERADGTRTVPLAHGMRPLWRDLPDLVDPNTAPPAWTQLYQDAATLETPAQLSLYSSGMHQDRGKNKDHDTIGERTFGVGAALLDPDRRTALVERAGQAEQAVQALEEALRLTGRPARSAARDLMAQYQLDIGAWVLRAVGPDPRTLALKTWQRCLSERLGHTPEEIAADLRAQHLLKGLPTPTPAAAPHEDQQQKEQKEELAWI